MPSSTSISVSPNLFANLGPTQSTSNVSVFTPITLPSSGTLHVPIVPNDWHIPRYKAEFSLHGFVSH